MTDCKLSLCVRKPTIWFQNRSDSNLAVQTQKKVRRLNFCFKKEEEVFPCSENKGADQLRSYCEADLRLCFRLCRLLVIPCGGSIMEVRQATVNQLFSRLFIFAFLATGTFSRRFILVDLKN